MNSKLDTFHLSIHQLDHQKLMFFLTPPSLITTTIRHFNYRHLFCKTRYLTTSLAQQISSTSETRPRSSTRCRETIKRRVALIVGYDGTPYHGIQRNPGVETVSDVLEKAIHAAGGISDENLGVLEKVKWQASARTDRGVSANGNVISFKILLRKDEEEQGQALDQIRNRINYHLPDHVRIFKVLRTTSSFSAKACCGARWYEYMLPLITLSPNSNFDSFEKLLRQFEGTHFFHNYTVGLEHSLPPRNQARRYIMEAYCDPQPITIPSCSENGDSDKNKWIRIRIKGQSFMLHQIRKMVSIALIVNSGRAPEDAIQKSFHVDNLVNIPPAPAAGLYLDSCHFDWYNERHSGILQQPISIVQSDYERELFKNEYILPAIARQISNDNLLDNYWETVNRHFKSF